MTHAHDAGSLRILIADSNGIFRLGLRAILSAEANIAVVAEADSARETVAAFQKHRPDVTILDLRMPETECVNTIKSIRAIDPKARVLILTDYEGGEDIQRGMRAGASGYLLKDTPPVEIVRAVRLIVTGKKQIDPALAVKFAEHTLAGDLSASERLVLERLAEGKTNQQIADAMILSESAVKFHINNILTKLDASNRTEAVVVGLKRGVIRLHDDP